MSSSQGYCPTLHKALNLFNTAFFYFTFSIITTKITNYYDVINIEVCERFYTL